MQKFTKTAENTTNVSIRERYVGQALDIWAPSWPRKVNRNQRWAGSKGAAARALLDAEGGGRDEPFISVYSFPRGHTKQGHIPRIDTLFIDFDFEGGDYERGSGDRAAWRRDLSHLLVRVRRVAKLLQEDGSAGWRAALSGHKGVHLYLDFPAISDDIGTFHQFVAGLDDYATELVTYIEEQTGISDLNRYVDVTSSDLGRLCRVPNTMHTSATESFGEDRFCVPVTIDELADVSVDEYEEWTRAPRPVPWDERDENERVHEVLAQHIATANATTERRRGGTSTVDWSRVEDYQEQSNDDIELEDIELLTSDRPCVWKFHDRSDKYEYGAQSHYMEMFAIRELLERRVPIDVIKEFLSTSDRYDADYSERRIKEIISRDYRRFRIDTLQSNAPEFCGYDWCNLCDKYD